MKYSPIILTLLVLFSCNFQEQNNQDMSGDITNEVIDSLDSQIQEFDFSINDTNRQKQIEELNQIIEHFPTLNKYTLYSGIPEFFIKGDFYGDGVEDIALLLKDSTEVKLCIINLGVVNSINFLGEDEGIPSNYSWVGEFKKVDKGEILWSNYEDDWRSIEEVPENEKVKLNYDAIFVHYPESCGGGFIFWKDEKFNWLQQE